MNHWSESHAKFTPTHTCMFLSRGEREKRENGTCQVDSGGINKKGPHNNK